MQEQSPSTSSLTLRFIACLVLDRWLFRGRAMRFSSLTHNKASANQEGNKGLNFPLEISEISCMWHPILQANLRFGSLLDWKRGQVHISWFKSFSILPRRIIRLCIIRLQYFHGTFLSLGNTVPSREIFGAMDECYGSIRHFNSFVIGTTSLH